MAADLNACRHSAYHRTHGASHLQKRLLNFKNSLRSLCGSDGNNLIKMNSSSTDLLFVQSCLKCFELRATKPRNLLCQNEPTPNSHRV